MFYLLFILDFYVLGDATSIYKGSFMRTKHLFVFINIRDKGEDVDPFCYLCFMFVFVILSYMLFVALCSPAGKGLTSSLFRV